MARAFGVPEAIVCHRLRFLLDLGKCPSGTMKARIKRTASLLQCAARYWSSDNASSTGAALAFYCAFSIAPLLVILLTLAGLFFSATAADAQVNGQLTALFGPAPPRSCWERSTVRSTPKVRWQRS
jgi:hypothetical protein